MKYAKIADGIVINLVSVTPELAVKYGFISVPDHIGIGWKMVDGEWRPKAYKEKVPEKVEPHKLSIALHRANLLNLVEAYVDSQPIEFQLSWRKAPYIYRQSALLKLAADEMGFTEQMIDDLFTTAKRIQT